MQIRTGLWSLEAAKSWLRSFEWGEAIACTIEENPDPLRQITPAPALSEEEICADAVHT